MPKTFGTCVYQFIKGLRTVATVEIIWGKMNYLTYIDYNT